jgi:hypothetical protein
VEDGWNTLEKSGELTLRCILIIIFLILLRVEILKVNWVTLEITTLETGGKDAKLHSKRLEKMQNYTRKEWRRCKTTLERSGEDAKLHSKRVEKINLLVKTANSFQSGDHFENRFPEGLVFGLIFVGLKTTLETSGKDVKTTLETGGKVVKTTL